MGKITAKILEKIRYPKFILLIITFIAAYLLLSGRELTELRNIIVSLGYFGSFLTGIFYVYGFTAGPATAVFVITAKHQNIVISGLLGGLGALIADIIIFRFIRSSFQDEIDRISNEKFVAWFAGKMSVGVKKYFIPVIASIIIASPLPDEMGVSLMATSKIISTKFFLVMSYVLNTGGIFVALIIGLYL